MESDLEDARKNMRSWLFADNIRRAVVLVLGPLMAKMGSGSCWGEDPVHPLPAVYQEQAKLVLSNMDGLEDKVDTASTKTSRQSWCCPTWTGWRTRWTRPAPRPAGPQVEDATGGTEEEATGAEEEEDALVAGEDSHIERAF